MPVGSRLERKGKDLLLHHRAFEKHLLEGLKPRKEVLEVLGQDL